MLRNLLDLDPGQRAMPALRYAADQLYKSALNAGPREAPAVALQGVHQKVIAAINKVQGFDKGPARDARAKIGPYLNRALAEAYDFQNDEVVEDFAYYLLALVTSGYKGENVGGTQVGNHAGDWRGGGFFDYEKSFHRI